MCCPRELKARGRAEPRSGVTTPARLVYIAGSGRSGSTLVERTLGTIPGWVNVGELIELFRKPTVPLELCGCGATFARCAFWSEVTRRAFGSSAASKLAELGALQRQISRQRFVPRLLTVKSDHHSAFADRLREYGATYDALYAAVAEVADADVIVDASKWPGQALALRRSLQRPVSLLHLVRDPRGVAYSWAKTSVRRPHAPDRNSVMATHSPGSTARHWAAFETEIAVIRSAFDSATQMRYEDFVADPAGRLRKALGELGLDAESVDLSHVTNQSVNLPRSHGVAGNPSRFTHGLVTFRRDDEWTRLFDTRSRRIVTAVTAPWLMRYGYPLSSADTAGAATSNSANAAQSNRLDGEWPPVDVVVPTRSRPELVREAVQSVVAQDYAGPLTILVVHDGEEPLQELTRLAAPNRRIELSVNTHAAGLAGARNSGLDQTTADYIASCDDDDTWDRAKLTMQISRMLDEPDLMVLGAGIRLLMAPDEAVDWPGDSPVVTRQQLLRSRRKELHSSTLVVRRKVFDVIGGYDERLPSSYAEDYEFLLRAVEVGKVGVVTTPLASIRKYNASWFRERAEVVAEALEYLLAKHPQLTESKAGHARILGQIAFARATMGDRRSALVTAGYALRRWPVAPHAALAITQATTGLDPRVLLGSVRKVGRGIT